MTQTSLATVAYPQVTVQRIAHFTDTYLPRRDGVVTSLRTLCAALDAEATLTVVPAPRRSGRRRCSPEPGCRYRPNASSPFRPGWRTGGRNRPQWTDLGGGTAWPATSRSRSSPAG